MNFNFLTMKNIHCKPKTEPSINVLVFVLSTSVFNSKKLKLNTM